MNKKIVGVIVIVLLVLLGGGAYFMMQKSKSTTAENLPAANPTEAAAAAETQGTLKSLLTAGKPQTCSFSTEEGSSGTVYVANGKMRGDFTSTTQGTTVTGHMILDSGYSYVWTDLTKQGMKIAIPAEQASGSTGSQGMDVNQKVSYSCKGWTVDNTKLALPSDVTFSTFNIPGAAAPKATGTNDGSAVNPACSACDSLPAAAQGPCKTQLNCE
jgi:uncharacterized protein (UPF0333 family)